MRHFFNLYGSILALSSVTLLLMVVQCHARPARVNEDMIQLIKEIEARRNGGASERPAESKESKDEEVTEEEGVRNNPNAKFRGRLVVAPPSVGNRKSRRVEIIGGNPVSELKESEPMPESPSNHPNILLPTQPNIGFLGGNIDPAFSGSTIRSPVAGGPNDPVDPTSPTNDSGDLQNDRSTANNPSNGSNDTNEPSSDPSNNSPSDPSNDPNDQIDSQNGPNGPTENNDLQGQGDNRISRIDEFDPVSRADTIRRQATNQIIGANSGNNVDNNDSSFGRGASADQARSPIIQDKSPSKYDKYRRDNFDESGSTRTTSNIYSFAICCVLTVIVWI